MNRTPPSDLVQLRAEMNAQWQRDLPYQDLLTDRWERARHLGFGEGSSIYQSAYVFGDVSVGRQTWIGPHVILDGSGGLTIGSFCSISAGVQIYSHDSVKWSLSAGEAPLQREATMVEDRCHIGPNAVVVKGVTIGAGSMVGAGAVVTHDVGPGSIMLGIPARKRGVVLNDELYFWQPVLCARCGEELIVSSEPVACPRCGLTTEPFDAEGETGRRGDGSAQPHDGHG
jgi:acetyltransferase-like isoleucine patch superfamily enzyme